MYGLSSFFIGEQRVAAELGPMMRAAPDEDMRIFLCTQIADEARHVAFFDRFYAEVGVLESDDLQDRLAGDRASTSTRSSACSSTSCSSARVDRLAVEPEDLETLVEAVTIYHMVIEGMLALTGQHFIIDYNERGDAAGLRRGLHERRPRRAPPRRVRRALPARDGAARPRTREAIQRTLVEVAPAADGVLKPKWMADRPTTRRRRSA